MSEQNETIGGWTAEELAELLNQPQPDGYHFPVTVRYNGRVVDVILSTQHAASSYGLPVVVMDGQAYGPADLPGLVLPLRPYFADAARRAGWTVEERPRTPEEQAEIDG